MTTSQTNQVAPKLTEVHWREYPVGFIGELARAFWRTLQPFLVGVGVAFVLIVVVGIVGEEGLVNRGLAEPLDLLMRMSMGVLLGVAYLAWVAVAVAVGLRETTTSKALDTAAASRVCPSAVPHPSQVEDVVSRPFGHVIGLAWTNIAIGGLALIVALAIMSEYPEDAQIVLLVAVPWNILMIGVVYLVSCKVRPAHLRRRSRIARHWSNRYEVAAWRAAWNAPKRSAANSDIGDQSDRLKLAGRLTRAGSVFTGLGLLFFYGYLFIRYPEAGRGRSEAGPPAFYGKTLEGLLDSAIWIAAAFAFAAVVTFLVGAVIEGAVRSVERSGLRRATEDASASRPPKQLLERYAERRSVRLAQVAAAVSGIALIVGTATLLLGTLEMAIFEHGVSYFAGLTQIASVTIAMAVALFLTALGSNAATNVRGQELRNELMRRWPTLPPKTPDSEGEVEPARKGPVLSRKPPK